MSAKAQEVAFDRVLVDRFKGGDQAAFNEMVSRYWDRIFSMVHQLLRNQQDAEEVTQDAFIRAHRGLVNFRGDSAFSTWLYQIATNLARNRYWYWWRRKRDKSVSIDAPVSAENDMTLADIIPAEVESPDDITVTQDAVLKDAAFYPLSDFGRMAVNPDVKKEILEGIGNGWSESCRYLGNRWHD